MSSPLISCTNVTVSYPGAAKDQWQLDIPDFTVAEGDLCLLNGDNMAGKSTLLKVMAGLSAKLTITGELKKRDVAVRGAQAFSDLTVILSSDDDMFPELSVLENVTIVTSNKELPDEASRAVERFLRSAGVNCTLKSQLGSLSSGGRVLVKFCRALLSDHPVILMDEISSFLDKTRSELVLSALIDLARSGRAAVLVSHSDRDRRFLTSNYAVRCFYLTRHSEVSTLCYQEILNA